MGFAKILARGAILGKKTAFGKLRDCGSSGCGIVVKKRAEMLDKDPTLQTLLSMSLLKATQPMI